MLHDRCGFFPLPTVFELQPTAWIYYIIYIIFILSSIPFLQDLTGLGHNSPTTLDEHMKSVPILIWWIGGERTKKLIQLVLLQCCKEAIASSTLICSPIAERVFSLLKYSLQNSSLEDYVETSLILQNYCINVISFIGKNEQNRQNW